MTTDLSKADEKLASLDMVLKSDSGFRSTSKGDRISANQWRDIMFIIADAEAYRKMRAADDMLAALEAAVECGMVPKSSAREGGATAHARMVHVADEIRAAIAKALGRTPNEIGETE